LNAQEKIWSLGNRCVRAAWLIGRGRKIAYHIGMKLLYGNESESVGIQGRLKEFAVFLNIFTSIPFRESEIEHFAAIEAADSSLGGAEAVDQPGECIERGDLKKANTVCRCLKLPALARGWWLISGVMSSR
jgi:hypothetical protein